MKKAKFLIYAALAASTVAISSCSDNDVLSAPAKETEGKALLVNPTVEGSRIATIGSGEFTSFKLFGFQNPPATQSQSLFFNGTEGYVYNGAIGSAWTPTETGAKWPANSDTNSSNFYAISIGGGSTLPSYTGVDLSNIQQGKFSYTAPLSGSDVDLSKQEDILVASSLNALQTDNDGVLNLPFTHAFAKVTFQLRFNSYENGQTTGNITDDYHFTIKSIIIHNVNLNGIYDYSSGWVASDLGDIIFEFPTAIDFKSQHLAGTDNIFQYLVNEANSILIVPQEFDQDNIWTSDGVNGTGHTHTALSTKPSAPYIEVIGWLWDELGTREGMINDVGMDPDEVNTIMSTYTNPSMYDLDDDTEISSEGYTQADILGMYTMPVANESTLGPGSVYYPIPAGFSFEINKKYNIRLDIYKAYNSAGAYVTNAAGQV